MQRAPLYRKVNTRARNHHHPTGEDYRHRRNTKASRRGEAHLRSMHPGRRRGLDYTPLFRFLLSRVGEAWDGVYGEAVARLDRPDPIFWLVARAPHERRARVCVGEATFYSGLFIDEEGRLQRVDPDLTIDQLEPACRCCTHTFNGVVFS